MPEKLNQKEKEIEAFFNLRPHKHSKAPKSAPPGGLFACPGSTHANQISSVRVANKVTSSGSADCVGACFDIMIPPASIMVETLSENSGSLTEKY